jgi:hypothetical protein
MIHEREREHLLRRGDHGRAGQPVRAPVLQRKEGGVNEHRPGGADCAVLLRRKEAATHGPGLFSWRQTGGMCRERWGTEREEQNLATWKPKRNRTTLDSLGMRC